MLIIAFLTPEKLYNQHNSGRSPGLPLKSDLPILDGQWCKKLFNSMGLTVAGTVPDFHRIPFFSN